MSDPEERFETLMQSLRRGGYRMTPQRMELVRLIGASDGHRVQRRLHTRIKQALPHHEPGHGLQDAGAAQRHGPGSGDRLARRQPIRRASTCIHTRTWCARAAAGSLDADLELEPATIRRLEHRLGLPGSAPADRVQRALPDLHVARRAHSPRLKEVHTTTDSTHPLGTNQGTSEATTPKQESTMTKAQETDHCCRRARARQSECHDRRPARPHAAAGCLVSGKAGSL